MTDFVHLRVHSEFSLCDSVVRLKPLMKAVGERDMPAVAVTDECNLFAIIKAYKAAARAGIKIIIGVDLWLADHREDKTCGRLTLLCQNLDGYRNLSRLITRGYLEGQHRGKVRILREWLTPQSCENLIALSGGFHGEVARTLSDPDALSIALGFMQTVFPGRFYLEVSRTGRDGEEQYCQQIVPVAAAYSLPLVATNDVRFIDADDYEAHEARVCIHGSFTLNDSSRPRNYSPQQYLRSPAEMTELFADMPEALANSVEIAKRCNLELKLGHSVLPDFPVPAGETIESHLRKESERGLLERLGKQSSTAARDYQERLDIELGVIEGMGFAGYFLIVADFTRWSRENGVPVGPGRGSGAGSLVAYCLGITDLDPLKYNLLFERFLNPERVSMPDFDIDFCMEGRDRVIDYVAERYGRERVSQIITYGTMAARAVVRDVGRVLGHGYGFVDRIAKLIPFEPGMTLDVALTQDAELRKLYTDDDEVRTLIDLAKRLEGLARNAGKHAGGVVIAPSSLTDFTPLYCEEGGSSTVTQLDKDDVESAGLVKFDFLGLRTLTILDRATATINDIRQQAGEKPLDMNSIPMDDPATFDLLKRCSTTAVFQLESPGMKDLIKKLRPDRFADIVALVALYRPGPLESGMVGDFIRRKHGEEIFEYQHPRLEPILEPTYGVILYQEQVMQIAQVLANYSLGGADLLRRAMGKKKASEMAKQRSVFVDGAVSGGVDKKLASSIFDLMEKFAGYGFNKSHSAAYALLAYQTAWQKAHYPAAFMAAVLSSDIDNTDKIQHLIEDCREMNLEILVPDVNRSNYHFAVAGDSQIFYGLGALKGVGKGAVENIVAERAANGAYTSLDDLCQRLDLSAVNRRVFEALIKGGALDSLGDHRSNHLANLPYALRAAEQRARAAAAGQNDLFGEIAANDAQSTPVHRHHENVPEFDKKSRLTAEKEALGLWLTGHPVDLYRDELDALVGGTLAVVLGPAVPAANPYGTRKNTLVGGLVGDMRRRRNQLSFKLEDRSGRLEVVVFEDVYERHRHLLTAERAVLVEGALRYDEFLNDWSLKATRIEDLAEARKRYASHLVILWNPDEEARQDREFRFVKSLKNMLGEHRDGECAVTIEYRGPRAGARLALGQNWRVKPEEALLRELVSLAGENSVKVLYPPGIATAGGGFNNKRISGTVN
ncbi:MAG: DNA polymerase III subunit alpha [Gammaproteobacteria bacterium]|nr:DNA polymerase III subunit alpha [Gammaproteobacteria bacterium]